MPLQKLQFRPGVNREGTNYSNEGGWYDCDKIRFRSGFPEKIGGWTRYSANQFLGTCRSMWNWIDLDGTNYLGLGTNLKYYVEKGGAYYDITPATSTITQSNILSVPYNTLGSALDATATRLSLVSAANFPTTGGIVKIDSEQMAYSGVDGNDLTGLTRGLYGSTAASHLSGAGVGCATISLYDATNAANTGDYVIISGASSLGGIPASAVDGNQSVGVVVTEGSAGYYTYTAINQTTLLPEYSTSQELNGGGTITVKFLLHVGSDIYTTGTGWGAGPWSRGTWGSGYASSNIGSQLRLWSNDNYGQDLVIAPRGGGIYYWLDSTGVNYRAVPLQDLASTDPVAGGGGLTYQDYVPTRTNQVIASSIQRFIIALGAESFNLTSPSTQPFDPMLVRWSDQGDPFNWVPDVTNQSGEFRLSNGSYIVAGETTRQENLIWTDSCIYSMQYLGPPYVWGFNVLMDNISIMSPNAAITVNNITYWMGTDTFYMYSGRVEKLPCSLRQFIFDDINLDQAYQVFCGSNEGYNEIWWFYCSANSLTVDKYVIYNYLDRVWYYGTMARTAWLDSGIRPHPMATDYNNRVLYHESGVDDVAGAEAAPIDAYVQSSDFDIGDGHNFGFVWRILPDVNFNGSNTGGLGNPYPYVTMTVKPRQNSGTPYGPADNPTVNSDDNYAGTRAYNIQMFDGQVYTRLRGRQMSFRIESNSLGVAWQLGSPRIDIRPDGRR